MAQLVDATEHSDVSLPELTISGTTGHCSEQEVIDLDDLANLVGADEATLGGTSIDGDKDTTLELEGESSRTLGEVSHPGRHRLEMPLELHLIVDRGEFEAEAIRADLVGESLLSLLRFFSGSKHLLGAIAGCDSVHRRVREALSESEIFTTEVPVHFHLVVCFCLL